MDLIEYNAMTMDSIGFQWQDSHAVAAPDGRVHAGSARTKDHRRLLMQKGFDDFLVSGHERTIPYLKGVGKT